MDLFACSVGAGLASIQECYDRLSGSAEFLRAGPYLTSGGAGGMRHNITTCSRKRQLGPVQTILQ